MRQNIIALDRAKTAQFAAETLARSRAEDAIRGLLAEPHGCAFCDSGLLRSDKPHAKDCPYEVAINLIMPAPAQAEAKEI